MDLCFSICQSLPPTFPSTDPDPAPSTYSTQKMLLPADNRQTIKLRASRNARSLRETSAVFRRNGRSPLRQCFRLVQLFKFWLDLSASDRLESTLDFPAPLNYCLGSDIGFSRVFPISILLRRREPFLHFIEGDVHGCAHDFLEERTCARL